VLCYIFLLEERSFLCQTFSNLLKFNHQSQTMSQESCWDLCSQKESCAAVSYDNNTSTCFLSDKPEVVINTEHTSRLCSVKKKYSEELVVHPLSTNLAKGKNVYI